MEALEMIVAVVAAVTFLFFMISFIGIPIAAIVSTATNDEHSNKWKTWWILTILFLGFPGYFYGALHFKKRFWRIVSVLIPILFIVLMCANVYMRYLEIGDWGTAFILAFETDIPEPENGQDN